MEEFHGKEKPSKLLLRLSGGRIQWAGDINREARSDEAFHNDECTWLLQFRQVLNAWWRREGEKEKQRAQEKMGNLSHGIFLLPSPVVDSELSDLQYIRASFCTAISEKRCLWEWWECSIQLWVYHAFCHLYSKSFVAVFVPVSGHRTRTVAHLRPWQTIEEVVPTTPWKAVLSKPLEPDCKHIWGTSWLDPQMYSSTGQTKGRGLKPEVALGQQ